VASIPRVFISSTGEDLEKYRQAVTEAVNTVGWDPVKSEQWAASSHRRPLDECLARVSACELVIVVVAERYGWEPEEQKDEPRKSITWLECEQAVSEGKEVLAFFVGAPGWPAEYREDYELIQKLQTSETTPELLQQTQYRMDRLAALKDWLRGLGIRRTVDKPRELQIT
jgi:hypothetical protein